MLDELLLSYLHRINVSNDLLHQLQKLKVVTGVYEVHVANNLRLTDEIFSLNYQKLGF